MITEVSLPICDADRRHLAELTLTCLRDRAQWRGMDTLVDYRGSSHQVLPAAPVQLLEEISYDYVVAPGHGRTVLRVEPDDLCTSAKDPARGRLEAKRATGTLTINVFFTDGRTGNCDVEIRSRKLNYESEYRSMLLRIAREGAELVQSAFAPSSLPAFRPDALNDPETNYQRFAFIKALLESEAVRDALHLLERRPHFEHVVIERRVNPARSVRAGPRLARELIAYGPRQSTRRPIAGLKTVPCEMTETSSETTYDTVPNRFVKYVLTRWRSIAVDVARVLSGTAPSERRGLREAEVVIEDLERTLSSVALAEAGTLTEFPHSNQVLQGRAGYRDILEAFLLAEAASTVDWGERERLFKAGQRNVAELYEYWVFLELVRLVEQLPGFSVDKRSLVRKTTNGLSLELRRTGESVVTAVGNRRGTPIDIDVWFNRTFSHVAGQEDGSWTVKMRPDCSLEIHPTDRTLDADTWIHFDAKYRIQELTSMFADSGSEEADVPGLVDQQPIAADLAKMHSYRDAIRRTAGAYVLYPGRDDSPIVQHTEYHEILPGLGAFVLRPTPEGQASEIASAALARFLEDVIDHVAAQGTAAERSRFWSTRSYARPHATRLNHEPLLMKPPSDTRVLLGYVKGPEHRRWIYTTRQYNLRADSNRTGSLGVDAPELSPDFVVLYDAHSAGAALFQARGLVSIETAESLLDSGYPDPQGSRYFCIALSDGWSLTSPAGSAAREAARSGRPTREWAAPLMMSWSDMAWITQNKGDAL